MLRDWDMDNVSDGKLYDRNDIVKTGCDGCQDCSECCHGMGSSIVIDPYDIYRMSKTMACTMNELLAGGVELNVCDGLILPNLRMSGGNESCYYLDGNGRCSIHQCRPGICRMFPLGRIYKEDGFRYFIQLHECPYEDKSEVRVSDWIDTDNMNKYERYITVWHGLLARWGKLVADCSEEVEIKQYMMYLLMQFYNKPYNTAEDYYRQFYERYEETLRLM